MNTTKAEKATTGEIKLNWPNLARAIKKQRAIERIMSQPFFMPRDGFYFGVQWPAWILTRLFPKCGFEPNVILGIDQATPGADRTAIGDSAIDDEAISVQAIHGRVGIKTWLEHDGAGRLVGMSQKVVYDHDGNRIEVSEPEPTGVRLVL